MSGTRMRDEKSCRGVEGSSHSCGEDKSIDDMICHAAYGMSSPSSTTFTKKRNDGNPSARFRFGTFAGSGKTWVLDR